jgi:glycerol-3-phosphate dehydrogenase
LPLLKTGALVVAWTEAEEQALDGILQQAHQNGVENVALVSRQALSEREPNLKQTTRAAVLIPDEHVIDPWSTPYAYLLQGIENGGQVRFATDVDGCVRQGDVWQIRSNRETLQSRIVINCAGLYGDRLDAATFGQATFEIRPRKGQFVVLDKSARRLVQSIILPVPNDITKGVLVCPTAFGNVLIGPTAEEQQSREDTSVDQVQLEMLLAKGRDIVPALSTIAVTASYAGLRPATETKDFRISTRSDQGWITVGGIRSTGLSAALGIARYVEGLYADMEGRGEAISQPAWPKVPNLAEHRKRDWQSPGYGEIVCHCELVTAREIRAAMAGPVPANSLSGLKRRTRATMGRCQGFYCSARLQQIIDGRFIDEN